MTPNCGGCSSAGVLSKGPRQAGEMDKQKSYEIHRGYTQIAEPGEEDDTG